jgi:hypothetical protein
LQTGNVTGQRQGEQRHCLGPQPWKRFGLFLRERAEFGRLKNGRKVGKMLQETRDSPSSTRHNAVAQCLTSAEHCRRLKCYQ